MPGQVSALAPINAASGGDANKHSDNDGLDSCLEIETVPETAESWRETITKKRDVIVGTKLKEVRESLRILDDRTAAAAQSKSRFVALEWNIRGVVLASKAVVLKMPQGLIGNQLLASDSVRRSGGGGDTMRWENQSVLGWTINRQVLATHLSLRQVCVTRYSPMHMFGVLFVCRLQQLLFQHDMSGVARTLVLVKRGSETDHEDGLS